MAASKQASTQASKQAYTHSRAQCSHANVGLAHARPNNSFFQKTNLNTFLVLPCNQGTPLVVDGNTKPHQKC